MVNKSFLETTVIVNIVVDPLSHDTRQLTITHPFSLVVSIYIHLTVCITEICALKILVHNIIW